MAKYNFSLSEQTAEMIAELAVDTAKKTGRGNKSAEVENAIRKEYKERFPNR